MYSVFPAFSFGDYRVQVTNDFSAKAKRLANQRIVESVEQKRQEKEKKVAALYDFAIL